MPRSRSKTPPLAKLEEDLKNDPAYKVAEYLKEAKDMISKWRDQAILCDKFVAGHQWDEDVVKILDEQKKPHVTFNRMKVVIKVVAGTEIQNRQMVRFVPRDPAEYEKAGAGDLATNGVTWALDNCEGEHERSVAFQDATRRGLGYTQTVMDTETDPNGKLLLRRVDGLEMWYDPWSREQNLGDARWFVRRRWMPTEEVKRRWPSAVEKLGISPYADMQMGVDESDVTVPTEVRQVTATRYLDGGTKITPGFPEPGPRGHLMVNEAEWYEIEPFYRLVKEDVVPGLLESMELTLPQPTPEPGMTETLINLTDAEVATLKEALSSMGEPFPEMAKLNRRVYKKAFTSGSVVLDQFNMKVNRFSFMAMSFDWDNEDKIWRGMAYDMIDPQKGANKWFSQGLYVFAANPKGSVLAEANSFKDPDQAAMAWGTPGAIIHLKTGALQGGKIKVEPPPPFPEAITQMVQYAITAFRDVTGINMDLMGTAEGQPTSGEVITKNQTQGLTTLASIFDSYTRYRHNEALTILEYLREYLSDGRWIRVGGSHDSQFYQLVKDKLFMAYDVVIDDSPRNPNQKKEVWTQLQPIIPILVRSNKFPLPLLDYLPLPASVISEIKKFLEQEAQTQAQVGQGEPSDMRSDPNYIAAQIAKTYAEAELSKARAEAVKVESQVGSLETMHDMKIQEEETKSNTTQKLAGAAEAVSRREDEDTLNNMDAVKKLSRPKSPGGR